MTERPILFSAEMVRAILDGRKTQTRRVMKVQPEHTPAVELTPGGQVWAIWPSDIPSPEGKDAERFCACPYGLPGDRLWVRETWAIDVAEMPPIDANGNPTCREVFMYRADGDEGIYKWSPSIFMPREASRITLEVVKVRAERVQDISEADIAAEGVSAIGVMPRWAFHELWDAINGKRAPWDSNPWVWVIEFKRISNP